MKLSMLVNLDLHPRVHGDIHLVQLLYVDLELVRHHLQHPQVAEAVADSYSVSRLLQHLPLSTNII